MGDFGAVIPTNKAGLCKKVHSKAWWGFVRWSARVAAEKCGGKLPVM